MRNAARHHVGAFQADAPHERIRFAGHGAADARCNVGFLLVVGDERDDLGLREHRAHAGDFQAFLALERRWPQLVEADLERARDHFEKTSRARRALVVHREIGHLARGVRMDGLAVLAADVEDGANVGVEVVRTSPVAADLGHILVGKRDAHATVSGGNGACDLVRCDTCALEHFAIRALGGGACLRARSDDDARDDLARLVHDDGVGGSRARVEPDDEGGGCAHR